MKQVNKQLMQAATQQQAESAQPLRSKEQSFIAAQKLWEIMTEYLTDKWVKKNGEVPSLTWIKEIGLLSDEQIRKGILKVRDEIRSGNKWAPDLADFLAMIHGHTDVDYHAAFMRCLNKSPEGRVEIWVYENAGYNIRTASHESAERMHKKFMKEAFEKERRGELVLNEDRLKSLPPNSVKNTNDLAREKYESEHGKQLHPRIAKILEAKNGKH